MSTVEERLRAKLSADDLKLATQLLQIPPTRIRSFIEELVRAAEETAS